MPFFEVAGPKSGPSDSATPLITRPPPLLLCPDRAAATRRIAIPPPRASSPQASRQIAGAGRPGRSPHSREDSDASRPETCSPSYRRRPDAERRAGRRRAAPRRAGQVDLVRAWHPGPDGPGPEPPTGIPEAAPPAAAPPPAAVASAVEEKDSESTAAGEDSRWAPPPSPPPPPFPTSPPLVLREQYFLSAPVCMLAEVLTPRGRDCGLILDRPQTQADQHGGDPDHRGRAQRRAGLPLQGAPRASRAPAPGAVRAPPRKRARPRSRPQAHPQPPPPRPWPPRACLPRCGHPSRRVRGAGRTAFFFLLHCNHECTFVFVALEGFTHWRDR